CVRGSSYYSGAYPNFDSW
nr:immunoglobulin heavy chain junction region [Macaca mulatta]MOW80224.1 immunoglobulin heavy chain junction region [Macaca mulatta]MOW81170.1 immunoglobulin heavy chain junction region [Macaca mulatta]MOW82459.1 immunoglobulin heavy chain junction region [Macaca mulatta]